MSSFQVMRYCRQVRVLVVLKAIARLRIEFARVFAFVSQVTTADDELLDSVAVHVFPEGRMATGDAAVDGVLGPLDRAGLGARLLQPVHAKIVAAGPEDVV